MKKILGILGLLLFVCITTAILNPRFLNAYNLQNIIRWTSLFAIISIGVSFVIISGGIDLSIGSTVGLTGTLLAYLLNVKELSVPSSLALVFLVSLLIGLGHGLLITRLRLQPFVVTLCGLLLYRGIARYLTGDQTLGFADKYDPLRYLSIGQPFSIPVPGLDFKLAIPMPLLIMLVLGVLAGVFLNHTIYGRYLLALGRNEQATRFSGINTDRMTMVAYVICSLLAGLGGVLFSLDVNSIQPSGLGEFYELYAIAAAVLGGCSLRGGEGTITGVIIGAAVMRVLYNAINVLGIPTQLEFAIIGLVILGGVVTDELIKRYVARRRAAREAE
ncbi:MAG TPA: ABC transporter permease [Candidatus Saccharimonadales bacterium]|nr:ABC transporter permease [Candidatus Saccharimonadales bacterium]